MKYPIIAINDDCFVEESIVHHKKLVMLSSSGEKFKSACLKRTYCDSRGDLFEVTDIKRVKIKGRWKSAMHWFGYTKDFELIHSDKVGHISKNELAQIILKNLDNLAFNFKDKAEKKNTIRTIKLAKTYRELIELLSGEDMTEEEEKEWDASH